MQFAENRRRYDAPRCWMTRWIGAVVAISALPADGLLHLRGRLRSARDRQSANYRQAAAAKTGEKFAKFRIYAVEGLPPQPQDRHLIRHAPGVNFHRASVHNHYLRVHAGRTKLGDIVDFAKHPLRQRRVKPPLGVRASMNNCRRSASWRRRAPLSNADADVMARPSRSNV
jgi:hypothetical protein